MPDHCALSIDHRLYAVTIAGSDSSAGAGIQADLAVFQALGVRAGCCVTAVTAQDERGVQDIFPLPKRAIEAQLASLFSQQEVDSCKIGMLWSRGITRQVARRISRRRPRVVVLDPVLAASAGGALAQGGLESVVESSLFPLCDVITPNVPEAETFLQCAVNTVADARAAALELSRRAGCAVILKGGHLPSFPGTDLVCQEDQVDLLPPDDSFPGDFHGSGCVFSSALAVFLAQKGDLVEAARLAKAFVSRWPGPLRWDCAHWLPSI